MRIVTMMTRARLTMVVVLVLALLPGVGGAARQQMFGLLFPELSPYNAPDDETLARLTAAGTSAEPGPMFDQNLDEDDNPDHVPAFFTYFGQFLDHDMTLDSLPVKVNGLDLPRRADGSAILGDGRNDENQVIAQIHVAFLRAYNRLIDQGTSFERARDLMEWRHQWIVVHEFLPEVLDPEVYGDVFRSDGTIHTRYYDPEKARKAEMPIEFSVGAYRFGHSQVRRAYNIIQGGGRVQV
jgi:heme peroxidase